MEGLCSDVEKAFMIKCWGKQKMKMLDVQYDLNYVKYTQKKY